MSDHISREAVIDAVKGTMKRLVDDEPKGDSDTFTEYCAKLEKLTSINVEILKALSALPSAKGGDAEMNEVKPQYMQVSPSNGADLISRADAVKAMWKALYAYQDITEKQFQANEELDLADWFQHRIFVQRMHEECMKAVDSLPSAKPTGELISRADAIEAVELADFVVDGGAKVVYEDDLLDRLNNLPSAETQTTDLISRADAIGCLPNGLCYDSEGCVDALKALPSAEAVKAVQDCRNCKYGSYNDRLDTWFCNHNCECSNWDLWESAEAEQTIRHIENNTKESDLVYRPSAEAVQRG